MPPSGARRAELDCRAEGRAGEKLLADPRAQSVRRRVPNVGRCSCCRHACHRRPAAAPWANGPQPKPSCNPGGPCLFTHARAMPPCLPASAPSPRPNSPSRCADRNRCSSCCRIISPRSARRHRCCRRPSRPRSRPKSRSLRKSVRRCLTLRSWFRSWFRTRLCSRRGC